MKHVLLVGAGHAHLGVLRAFAADRLAGATLTLLTRERATPYSGMLPGYVAGHYTLDDMLVDSGDLARSAGARLCHDEAVGLDPHGRRVLPRHGPPLAYDVLSLNVGAQPNTETVPGAWEHAAPIKPIEAFLPRFDALRARVREGRSRRVLMVGGGAGGVELLLALVQRLRGDLGALSADPATLAFTLLTAGQDILPAFPRSFRDRFRTLLAERGVAVRTNARVVAVEPGAATLATGCRVVADEILWATEAAPSAWLRETGLALDPAGFLRVDGALRAFGHSAVFAAGDTIAFDPEPLPRSGVHAVRAGPVLADNIRAALSGAPLRNYRPQRDALYLVSTGTLHAIGTRNGLVFAGEWVWRWKDLIDRRFVRRSRAPA